MFLTTATPNPSTGRTTATSDSTITKYTFDGSSFTAVPGWAFPLKNTGMIDARDMALVGDTFYVSDGYDFRDGTEFNSSGISGDHLIYVYTQEEQEVSYRRRILHGKIDILRAELVARLQKTGGRSVLDDVNVAALTEILAGKATPLSE